jgi:hypothetical protein
MSLAEFEPFPTARGHCILPRAVRCSAADRRGALALSLNYTGQHEMNPQLLNGMGILYEIKNAVFKCEYLYRNKISPPSLIIGNGRNFIRLKLGPYSNFIKK